MRWTNQKAQLHPFGGAVIAWKTAEAPAMEEPSEKWVQPRTAASELAVSGRPKNWLGSPRPPHW